MLVFELPTVTLIPNGSHHPPIEDGRLLPKLVKGNRQKYEKAFLTVSEKDNFGEGTFFVAALLELLLDTQREVRSELEENNKLRHRAKIAYKRELSHIPFAFEVFQVYFDHFLYYPNESLSRKAVLDTLNVEISPYMLRKIEAELLNKELIKKAVKNRSLIESTVIYE